MTHHILVAEPSNETWTSIAHGVRRYQPAATLFRVKDGEQAFRFLFQQGLLLDEPETPQMIVLNSELSIIPTNALVARIRQHPRTQTTPIILISQTTDADSDDPSDGRQWLHHRQSGVIVITGENKLEREVADAMYQLSSNSLWSLEGKELAGTH